MKYKIHIGNKPIILEHDDFEQTINVDDLTKIDTSNIFGEAVTISAAANRIGLIKAEVGSIVSDVKLRLKIFEGTFKEGLRKQAADDSGFFKLKIGENDVRIKATEKALETAHETDSNWITLKKELIQSEKNFEQLDSLYWATMDKSKKLSNLVNGTTPEDFVANMITGKINGILITK